jgi:Leucine-rich repeat (LRR) protein
MQRLPSSLSTLSTCVHARGDADSLRTANLLELSVGSNALTELPPWLGVFRRLLRFQAPSNRLVSVHASLFQCTMLGELNLSHNAIESLPSDVALLRQLTDIDVSGNELRTLPVELRALPHLVSVKFTGNRGRRPKQWPRAPTVTVLPSASAATAMSAAAATLGSWVLRDSACVM